MISFSHHKCLLTISYCYIYTKYNNKSMIFRTIVLGCFAICYLMSNILRSYLLDMDIEMNGLNADKTLTQLIENHSSDYRWALKMTVNSIGYCCVFLPGILIYHYAHKIKYFDRCGKTNAVWIIGHFANNPVYFIRKSLFSFITG